MGRDLEKSGTIRLYHLFHSSTLQYFNSLNFSIQKKSETNFLEAVQYLYLNTLQKRKTNSAELEVFTESF